MFLPLTPEQLRQILDLMLKKEVKLLAAQGVTLEISEAAMALDAGAERSPGMGRAAAAPHHPEEPARAAGRLAAHRRAAEGRQVAVDAGEGGLVFKYA